MKKALLAVLFIIALTVTALAQSSLKVGDKAPEFTLPNGDGKPVSLIEFTSRAPLVVIFYRGFW